MMMAGDIDLFDPKGRIRCEVDGKSVRGVYGIFTEFDSNRKICTMIVTDQMIAAHLASESRRNAPRMALYFQGEGKENNNKDAGAGGSRG